MAGWVMQIKNREATGRSGESEVRNFCICPSETQSGLGLLQGNRMKGVFKAVFPKIDPTQSISGAQVLSQSSFFAREWGQNVKIQLL